MTDTVLSISDLRVGYEGSPVLHGTNLSVKQGELCGLIGPNGHGKSTLLRAVSGLIARDSGSIVFQGKEIAGMKAHEIVNLGLIHVPQGDMLFPEMTVLDNLLIGAVRSKAKDHAEESLEFVLNLLPRLRERSGQSAFTLSGGERRMVAIGRGLMGRGSLLLLDEPSLGLAPAVIDEIYEVIRGLVATTGHSVLLVEENATRAAEVSDRLVLMDHGETVWQGRPEDMSSQTSLDETYFGG